MTYLDYLEQKVLLERLVIGLEEPVLIKGLGELSAKIDSGNGGYNVIHGTDFHQQGNELMFTTHDSFGHEKKMQATVIDTIEVNMGGGNIESRPVIELDIKFAGEDYKKIPFSVSDRSTNSNPILISKGFVENELKALIDVGAMNISHDGIDVVYGESWLKGGDNADLFSPIKSVVGGTAKGIKAVAGGAKDLVKGTYNAGKTLTQDGAGLVKGLYGAGKNIVGDGAGITKGLYNAGKTVTSDLWNAGEKVTGAIGGIAGLVAATGITAGGIKLMSSLAKKISFAPSLLKSDTTQIKTRIASASNWIKFLKDNNAIKGTILEHENSINPSITKILPIVSFTCQKGIPKSDNFMKSLSAKALGLVKIPNDVLKKKYVQGQAGRAESWKKQIESAKKGIEYLKQQKASNGETLQNQEQTQEDEEELLNLSEAFDLLLSENDSQDNQNTTQQNQQVQNQQQGEDTSEQQEILTSFDDLGLFQLWFVPISSHEKAIDTVTKTFISSEQFDSDFGKLFDSGKVTKDSVGNVIKNISAKIKKITPQVREQLAGMWCLSISTDANKPEKREYHFFQQEPYLIYVSSSETQVDTKKVTAAFEQKFPVVKQAIIGLQKAINQDSVGLAKKIISGEAFQNEINQGENFQQLTIAIQQLQNFAKQYKEKGYAEEPIIKMLAEKLKENPEMILTPFITEFTYNELNKDDVGHEILQVITNNGQFAGAIKNYNDLIDLITKQKQAEQILLKSEDEEWVEQKLQSFRSKGLI